MFRNRLRPLVFGIALITTIAAFWGLQNPAHFIPFMVDHLGVTGEYLMGIAASVYAHGVVFPLMVMGLGTLTMAVCLGAIPRPSSPVLPQPIRPVVGLIRRIPVTICLSVGGSLALGSAWLLSSETPGSESVAVWVAAVLCTGIGYYLWDRIRNTPIVSRFPDLREWRWVALFTMLHLILVGYDIDHWRWGGTPDESYFFEFAENVIRGNLSDRFILSEFGVFDYHPVLSSYYQALFMKLFGRNVFGWRLSSVAAFSLSLPFLYLFGRTVFGKRFAWMTMIFYGSSQIAITFAHYGYNNAQVYPVLTAALGVGAWSMTQRSLFGYFLAGTISGLGWYTYYPARITPLLLVLMAVCAGKLPLAGKDRMRTIAVCTGIGITLIPVLMNLDSIISNMISQTAVTGGETIESQDVSFAIQKWFRSSGLSSRFFHHWVKTLVFGVWYHMPHHLMSNPVMDPISGLLALIGFWIVLGSLFRRWDSRFLMASYIICTILIGATSPYDRPPLTRLLFFAPWLAFFSAIPLERVADRLKTIRSAAPPIISDGWIGMVIVSALWSVINVQYNVIVRNHGYGEGTTSELVRVCRTLPKDMMIIYIQRADTYMECANLILWEYGVKDRVLYFKPLDQQAIQRLSDVQPPFAVFHDLQNVNEITTVNEVLRKRFFRVEWQDTDAGQPWNIRYTVVERGR